MPQAAGEPRLPYGRGRRLGRRETATRGSGPLTTARSLGPAAADERARRTLAYRWVCLGLLFAGILLAFLVRLAPAVALPELQVEYALSIAEAGLMTSVFMWPFALMQPVAGAVADRLGPRATVTVFLAIAAAGQLLFALAPDSSSALIGRSLTGVGFATLFVAGAMIMSQWFRPRAFSFLTGIWTSVGNLGSVAAATPLALLIAFAGWRFSFALIGLAVALLTLLTWAFLRNRPADLGLPSIAEVDGTPPPAPGGRPMPLLAGVRRLFRTRTTWLLCGYGFTLFGTMTMMQGFFAVPYLMGVHGFTKSQVADCLTLWAVGLIAGCALWGYVASHLARSLKTVALRGAVTYGLLWLLLAVWPDGLPAWLVWGAMLWGGFFVATWIPCYAMLRDAVPAELTGVAMGVLNMSLWLGGAFYQQLSAFILEAFAGVSGVPPLLAYQVVIWLSLASVGLSVALIAAVGEAAPPRP